MNFNHTTLRDYIRILFRRKAVVIIIFLTVLLSVYVGLQLQTRIYQAEVKILITGTKESGAVYYKNLGVDDTEISNTQSALVTSTPVLSQVVKALQLDQLPVDYEKKFATPLKRKLIEQKATKIKAKIASLSPKEKEVYLFQNAIEQLRSNIEVELLRYTNLLSIRVKDFDPKQAAVVANVISRAYVIFDLQQQLVELQLKYGNNHPIIQQIQDNITAMQGNLSGEPLSEIDAIGPATVKIIEQAFPPLRPLTTPKNLTKVAGVLLGLILSIVFAISMDYLDQNVKTPREAERLLRIPFLGFIPQKRWWQRLVFKNVRSKSFYAKNYHNLAEQITLLNKEKALKTILFTSTENREGTTSIVANIGFLLANYSDKRVLVVDLNLRHPGLHACFGRHRNPGFVEVFEKEETFENAIQNVSDNLQMLSSGRNGFNPALVLHSENIGHLLEKFKPEYDFILIDCANLKNYKDAVMLSSHVDGVILVISENRTNQHTIQSVLSSFNHLNSKLVGFVFNKRTFAIPKFIYERV